jgi:hypothetical protein
MTGVVRAFAYPPIHMRAERFANGAADGATPGLRFLNAGRLATL